MELVAHPSLPTGAVRAITVSCTPSDSGLALHYRVQAPPAGLVIPAATEPARADGLWRSTCFELFVRGEGLSYCEFNFSPSGQWAAYWFDSYRSGMRELQLPVPPRIRSDETGDGFILAVEIGAQVSDQSRIGLSAVIEEAGGAKSYWALAHAEGAPDFHHDACFAVHLAAIA